MRFSAAERAIDRAPPWIADVVAAVDGTPAAHVPLDIQGTEPERRRRDRKKPARAEGSTKRSTA